MGKRTKKVKRGEVTNTDFQTPKNGSKRRQNFSPSGLTPEEKVIITKPGSIGATPSTSFSAVSPETPLGHGQTEGSPDLVSAAPSDGCRPRENPGNPTVASGSGGLGDGHHDLFRGTSHVGPGASTEATTASKVAAGDGSSDPNSPGASLSPAEETAVKSNIGYLADLLGIPEAEVARDPLCRAVASCPGKPQLEVGQTDGSNTNSSKAEVVAPDGLLHPNSGETSTGPASTSEAMDATDDSQSSFVTTNTTLTANVSNVSSGSTIISPEPSVAWGENISSVLSKDKARKLRRKENIKNAKARKAEGNLSAGVAAFNISGVPKASGLGNSTPKKDDGPGAKKAFNAEIGRAHV